MEILTLSMFNISYSENLKDTDFWLEKRKIVKYLENRHLSDGGYFFAQVEPSSGLDTYLAVKTLNLLGEEIKHTKSIVSFWESKEKTLDNLFGIFLAVETYKELGLLSEVSRKYKAYLLNYSKKNNTFPRITSIIFNKGFKLNNLSFAMNYISSIGKELEDLYYFAVLCRDLKIKIDKKRVINFVLSLNNEDGGFGQNNNSNLMTTHHALSILNIFSYKIATTEETYNYLMSQWEKCDYLEDVFYITESIILLKKPFTIAEKIFNFVSSCQRKDGGFSRCCVMGIQTIEDTYYAVKILKTCEKYSHKVLLK